MIVKSSKNIEISLAKKTILGLLAGHGIAWVSWAMDHSLVAPCWLVLQASRLTYPVGWELRSHGYSYSIYSPVQLGASWSYERSFPTTWKWMNFPGHAIIELNRWSFSICISIPAFTWTCLFLYWGGLADRCKSLVFQTRVWLDKAELAKLQLCFLIMRSLQQFHHIEPIGLQVLCSPMRKFGICFQKCEVSVSQLILYQCIPIIKIYPLYPNYLPNGTRFYFIHFFQKLVCIYIYIYIFLIISLLFCFISCIATYPFPIILSVISHHHIP